MISVEWMQRAKDNAKSGEHPEIYLVECVTFEDGFERPTDSLWRVGIGGIYADCDTHAEAVDVYDCLRALAVLATDRRQ